MIEKDDRALSRGRIATRRREQDRRAERLTDSERKTPHASASDGIVVTTMTQRATVQMATPRKNVRRKPIASVSEPASKVKTVIAGAQTQPTNAPALDR